MNDRQEDKLSMYFVVREFLAQHAAASESIPAFAAARTAFSGQVDAIQALVQQMQPTTGLTGDKSRLRTAMADAAMPVVGALKALAAVTSNGNLAAQADASRSDFLRGRDTAAADRADQIHALAAARTAELAEYGIAAAKITALRIAIDAYRAAVTGPRQTIAANAAARAQLADAFAAADATLHQRLDNLAELFRTSNPGFYLGYHSAREIVDGGGPVAPPLDSSVPTPNP